MSVNKFKVGDVVKCVDVSSINNLTLGKEYIVIHIRTGDGSLYLYDDNGDGNLNIGELISKDKLNRIYGEFAYSDNLASYEEIQIGKKTVVYKEYMPSAESIKELHKQKLAKQDQNNLQEQDEKEKPEEKATIQGADAACIGRWRRLVGLGLFGHQPSNRPPGRAQPISHLGNQQTGSAIGRNQKIRARKTGFSGAQTKSGRASSQALSGGLYYRHAECADSRRRLPNRHQCRKPHHLYHQRQSHQR